MRWVKSLDNCKIILSGMSDEAQVADNLATFETPQKLTQEELQVVSEVRAMIEERTFVGCTNCKYCMPCPFGVDIPGNFRMMNNYAKYSNENQLRFEWKDMEDAERADRCRACGKCETACPQQIPIRAKLREIAARMKDQ